ncbi:MAG: hypothetical protein ACP5KJ_04055, partial [Candidatus Micrarchaeia archaeon]
MEESKQYKKPSIPTHGILSKDALYLPAHYSDEIRKFQEDSEVPLRNYWSYEEVLNFVFPKKYQRTYNEIAIKLIRELLDYHTLRKKEITSFVKSNGFSKATFYNRVLPRLKRVGMIKVERETISPEQSKRKYRPMRISLSKTFGNYLCKIGESWLACIDDARSKPPKERPKEKEFDEETSKEETNKKETSRERTSNEEITISKKVEEGLTGMEFEEKTSKEETN